MPKEPISKQYQKNLDTIGIYLCELRFSDGLTQAELAEQANLHRNTILRAEKGQASLVTLFKLADVFEICPTDLISIID